MFHIFFAMWEPFTMIRKKGPTLGIRLFVVLFLAVSSLTMFTPFLPKAHASALGFSDSTPAFHLSYVNRSHIRVDSFDPNGMLWNASVGNFTAANREATTKYINDQLVHQELVDGKFDSSWDFSVDVGGCKSYIDSDRGNSGLNVTKLSFTFNFRPPGQDCDNGAAGEQISFIEDGHTHVTINEDRKYIMFNWVDDATLVRVDGGDGDFQPIPEYNQPNRFYKVNENGQGAGQDYVEKIDDGSGVYHMRGDNAIGLNDFYQPRSGGVQSSGADDWATVEFGDKDKLIIKGTPGSSSSTATSSENCESSLDFELSWAVCGVLSAVDKGLSGLYSVTLQMLTISQEQYNQDQLKQAWSYFRNLASFLLVIIGLVMIIGQAVGKD